MYCYENEESRYLVFSLYIHCLTLKLQIKKYNNKHYKNKFKQITQTTVMKQLCLHL